MRHATLGWMAAAVLGLAAAPASAQDGPSEMTKRLGERRIERQADKLGLTGDVREKFLALHREATEKTREAEAARDKAVRDLLTPTQRETYDAAKKNPFGGLADLEGSLGDLTKRLEGLGEGLGLPRALSADSLAKELGLDDAQRALVRDILTETAKKQADGAREMKFDAADPAAMVEQGREMQKRQAEVRKVRDQRIRAILNESQKAKYDAAAKKADASPAFGMHMSVATVGPDGEPQVLMAGGEDAPGGVELVLGDGAEGGEIPNIVRSALGNLGGGSGGGASNPAGVKKDLRLSADEESVILPLVEKILEAQKSHATWRRSSDRELRRAVKDGADGEAVGKQLGDIRARETKQRESLKSLRDDLRALVTLEQEAVLVGHGVLD